MEAVGVNNVLILYINCRQENAAENDGAAAIIFNIYYFKEGKITA